MPQHLLQDLDACQAILASVTIIRQSRTDAMFAPGPDCPHHLDSTAPTQAAGFSPNTSPPRSPRKAEIRHLSTTGTTPSPLTLCRDVFAGSFSSKCLSLRALHCNPVTSCFLDKIFTPRMSSFSPRPRVPASLGRHGDSTGRVAGKARAKLSAVIS